MLLLYDSSLGPIGIYIIFIKASHSPHWFLRRSSTRDIKLPQLFNYLVGEHLFLFLEEGSEWILHWSDFPDVACMCLELQIKCNLAAKSA